jgi:hypothetical protein
VLYVRRPDTKKKKERKGGECCTSSWLHTKSVYSFVSRSDKCQRGAYIHNMAYRWTLPSAHTDPKESERLPSTKRQAPGTPSESYAPNDRIHRINSLHIWLTSPRRHANYKHTTHSLTHTPSSLPCTKSPHPNSGRAYITGARRGQNRG